MSILSTTNSGKSSVLISEEFLRKQNWRKYASWDNIFVPAQFEAPLTFIQVNSFVDSKYKEHKVFFTRMHDLESGINTKILSFTVKISRARIKLGNIFSCVNNG